ncbi:DsbA family protein [Chitinophaga sp.]|uniref:DsbA family protein n=1 Tax=Chitinophaga sp. TaxID=1869181 RepID=UPI002631CDD2|nr:DsbA family protein [uncultured Chitinophaga sp.]
MNGSKTGLRLTYFTDPLCCWSWALEPVWQQVRETWQGQLQWRYVMGGLIKDWSSYRDTMQAVSRPVQMGPVWLEAKYASGQPFNEKIWITDPPASSWPACLAVKCAGMQGKEEEMLFALRYAVMAGGRNIARKEVLISVAEGAGLDMDQFRKDLVSPVASAALQADMNEAQLKGIHRYPTFILAMDGRPGVLFTGYRPAEAWHSIIKDYLEGQESAA